jgi:hypothetical protein
LALQFTGCNPRDLAARIEYQIQYNDTILSLLDYEEDEARKHWKYPWLIVQEGGGRDYAA